MTQGKSIEITPTLHLSDTLRVQPRYFLRMSRPDWGKLVWWRRDLEHSIFCHPPVHGLLPPLSCQRRIIRYFDLCTCQNGPAAIRRGTEPPSGNKHIHRAVACYNIYSNPTFSILDFQRGQSFHPIPTLCGCAVLLSPPVRYWIAQPIRASFADCEMDCHKEGW